MKFKNLNIPAPRFALRNPSLSICASRRAWLSILFVIALAVSTGLSPLQAANADVEAGTISGVVFQDFNSNGTRDTSGAGGAAIDRGIAGVNVYAYDDAGTRCGTAASSGTGSYTLNHTCGGATVRVEFIGLPSGYYEAPSGPSSNSAVQVVNANATNVNLGINHPCDYCQANPKTGLAVFVNGATNGTGTTRTLVSFDYSFTNGDYVVTEEARKSEIGSIWGLAWNRDNKKLFSASVLKRHVGLGPGGLGAIYVTDFASAGTPTTQLTAISNVGTINTAARGLTNPELPSFDSEAFTKVGKVGLGDLDISEDGKTLFVVNLNTKRVVQVNITGYLASGSLPTAGDITLLSAYPVAGCTNGTDRPFGLSVYRGKLYLGVVCDGSVNRSATDISARVYAYDLTSNTWASVLGPFSLNYERGPVFRDSNGTNYPARFNAWVDTFAVVASATWSATRTTWMHSPEQGLIGHPQPLLTDVEFDDDGSMILGLADRSGLQMGSYNYGPNTNDTTLWYDTAQGEMLRAYNNGGSFVLESNGTTLAGGGNNCPVYSQSSGGLGGAEYYCGDGWSYNYHSEQTFGGLARFRGSADVVVTALNPKNSDPWDNGGTGGLRKVNNQTGAQSGYQQVYNNWVALGNFGKSQGTGDVEILCDPAPTVIGGRAWNDANGDGTQDPSESAFANLTVRLLNASGAQLATTTTNAAGRFQFSSATTASILPNTNNYRVVIATNQPALSSLSITAQDAPVKGQDSTQDDSDSDASLNGGDASVTVNTGQAGASILNLGYGFGVSRATIGDRVWNDTNSNGQQDAGEFGVPGAMVKLLDTNDAVLLSTATDLNGIYSFVNVLPGSYKVQFVKPNGFNFTTKDVGDDTADSDADPVTGNTAVFAVVAGQINNTIDAGLQSIKANLSGRAWNDMNRNGQQDVGEPGMSNVPVSLFDSGGNLLRSTVTDGISRYDFTSLEPGSYQVRFTTVTNFGFTVANVGPDATDSDGDQTTGLTALIPLAPGETSSITDIGLILIKANLSGRVWTDLNRDGQRVGSEPPVGGVTVQLLDNANTVLQSTSTDISGQYAFMNINPGTYKVKFIPPVGYLGLTLANVGNDATDSDPTVATATTDPITLVAGQSNTTTDAGLWVANAVIGDYVWIDLNNNGLQDGGEPGMPEADVTLYDVNGNAIRTQTTDGLGRYTFTEVPPGAYSLGFALPSSFALTAQKVGNNPAIDSDPHPDTARTALFTLLPGESNLTIDAGVKHVKPQIRVTALVNGNRAPASPGPSFTTNSMIALTYVISNSGNAPLVDIVLTDSVLGNITNICPFNQLAEGTQMTCTTTRLVSPGLNSHTVTVTATTPADLNALALGEDVVFYTGN
jgi:protocatechuate 3,4-dioxygenase beta subunit